MRLFFDTETTGFTQQSLPADHPSQPHLVELAAILTEDDGRERQSIHFVVKPNGYMIPKKASDVHGITTEIALRIGVPLIVAVASFVHLRSIADEMIAHNVQFDLLVMASAIHRTGKKPSHPGPGKHSCTVDLATPILNIPATPKMRAAGYGNKPKMANLGECFDFFFKEKLIGAHGAMSDARGCMRVFYHILNRAS